jgi:hypothetical protein
VFYPLRNTEKVRAAVYDAREELLEEDAGPTTFVIQPNGLLNSLAIVLTIQV